MEIDIVLWLTWNAKCSQPTFSYMSEKLINWLPALGGGSCPTPPLVLSVNCPRTSKSQVKLLEKNNRWVWQEKELCIFTRSDKGQNPVTSWRDAALCIKTLLLSISSPILPDNKDKTRPWHWCSLNCVFYSSYGRLGQTLTAESVQNCFKQKSHLCIFVFYNILK